MPAGAHVTGRLDAVAKWTIENYDRLAKVEASLEQIKSSLDKLNGED